MTSRKRPEVKFAPREVFEHVLEYAVIPTFDLVVELPEDGGVVLARRTIAPYRNKRALPGLMWTARPSKWSEVPPATGAMYRPVAVPPARLLTALDAGWVSLRLREMGRLRG